MTNNQLFARLHRANKAYGARRISHETMNRIIDRIQAAAK